MRTDFSFEIEICLEPGVDVRRFCWVMQRLGEPDYRSNETFATKREATQSAEIEIARVRQRGRLRPGLKREERVPVDA